jgi:hypothetical protein
LRRRQRRARAIRRRQQVCRVALDCRAAPPRKAAMSASFLVIRNRPRHVRVDGGAMPRRRADISTSAAQLRRRGRHRTTGLRYRARAGRGLRVDGFAWGS